MRASSERIWNSITSLDQSGDQEDRNRTDKINREINEPRSANSDCEPRKLNQSNRRTNGLVDGYTGLVRSRVQDGWSCYLLTILFAQLPGSRAIVLDRMKDHVQRVYSTLVTRINRRPTSASPDQLPVLLGAIDLPVQKNKRTAPPLVRCNDGLHFHAILLIPRRSRLKQSLADHFDQQSALYTGPGKLIQRMHVKPVVTEHGRVVDYVLKTITNGRLSYDDAMLILPRARQELSH